MTRTIPVLVLLGFSWHPAHSQTPAFEVASITPCKPGTAEPLTEHMGIANFISPGGRFTARATTLKFLLEWAYGIQPAQHSGGPSWIGLERYDVVATAEGNPSDDQIKLMVQNLLADRFHLKLHHERKEISAYVISVGKTAPKLFPPKDGETHALRLAPGAGPDQKTHHVIATRFTLAQLTDIFARQLGSVIVNRTGLDGEFDFTLDITSDDSRPNPLDPALLIDAMREQLGLTVKFQKTPVDLLVIDSAVKVEAGNEG